MDLLLDTHSFLWFAENSPELSIQAKDKIENIIEILPVHFRHLKQLLILPFYHRDPFDRLILSQAISENLVIVTKDGVFEKYTSNTLW